MITSSSLAKGASYNCPNVFIILPTEMRVILAWLQNIVKNHFHGAINHLQASLTRTRRFPPPKMCIPFIDSMKSLHFLMQSDFQTAD